MQESRIRQLLAKLRHGLEELYDEHLEGLYLYGSHARAEAAPESDVDVLIVLDEVADYGREIERTGYLVSRLALEYEVSISRVFVSSLAWRHRDSSFLCNLREHAKAA
jgi:predicted nucleotidyltransferase